MATHATTSLSSRGPAPGIVEACSVPSRPWREGNGPAHVLLAWPDVQAWHTRVSLAQITADAPFSSLPGVTRWFAALLGDGVELRVDGRPHAVTPQGSALCFDGGAATTCRLLGGATRVLNLMLRGRRGGLVEAMPGEPWSPEGRWCALFTDVAGRLEADGPDPASWPLAAASLAWFADPPRALRFVPGAGVAGAAAGTAGGAVTAAPGSAWWLWSDDAGPALDAPG